MNGSESLSSQIAAWVEAIGAIAAVIGAGWVATRDSRATRQREERSEAAALRKEERAVLATRTAALNLAILASTQITDLHLQLKSEAWRGRVTRVSASRALLTTERMLTAFPIQSLAGHRRRGLRKSRDGGACRRRTGSGRDIRSIQYADGKAGRNDKAPIGGAAKGIKS